MWYPPRQQHYKQQQRWHGYNHHLSSQQQQQQQQQQSYSRTSYYCNTDESLTANRATTTYLAPRNDENESFIHYHPTRADDVSGKKKFLSDKFDLHLRIRSIIYMSTIIFILFFTFYYYLSEEIETVKAETECVGSYIKCFDRQ